MSESKEVLQRPLRIASNRGVLVLFDPTLLQHRVKDPSTWWKDGLLETRERRDGRLAVWPLSAGKAAGGPWRVRLGTELDPSEEPFAVGSAEPTPLVIEGPEVFLGPIERVPGDGAGDRLSALPEQGRVLPWAPGRYLVLAHVLNWQGEERFWTEDNEPVADAPPDFVLVAEAVDGELPAPASEPQPLLELIPGKTPTASKKVRFATRPRTPIEEPKKPGRRRSAGGGVKTPREAREKRATNLPQLRPGEMGVGAEVRHPMYGIGTVLFVREGFPKARVRFHGGEEKVDKDTLTVI